ncbi:hypothetical protein G4451_06460 [Fusicatenibacter saccharivorans]|uniref:DarT1-associated NADAR antitoxin family protein n=1 Tax=Fusicatenibacter saccharivorans TaxID=1150298 RepID=UPI00156D622F|nr:hypothetical protein [Fusicatenibacter saccharivorans]NSE26226.1 hypothetical protein [Fusicatenibacter saccharivorans]
MAEKSVFISKVEYPFFEEVHVNIDWFGGFALSQKRKCQIGLHQNFLMEYPKEKILEISSSSLMSLGAKLSAMHLNKRTLKGITTVESAFQSSRIYGDGAKRIGPFPEYRFLPGRECKKLVKEAAKEMHSYQYELDGLTFYAPAHHISQFYDFLYLNALLEPENEEVKNKLLQEKYTAFTDLATKSLNCQARSAAIFVGLVRAGMIDEVRDYDSYLKLFRTQANGKAAGPLTYEHVQLLYKDKVRLFSPVVPCRFHKTDVEAYYAEHCSMLTNRKGEDNYLDLRMHRYIILDS